MSYEPTIWQNHVETESGEVIQVGTPQSAENFNKMENGIKNLYTHMQLIFCKISSQRNLTNISSWAPIDWDGTPGYGGTGSSSLYHNLTGVILPANYSAAIVALTGEFTAGTEESPSRGIRIIRIRNSVTEVICSQSSKETGLLKLNCSAPVDCQDGDIFEPQFYTNDVAVSVNMTIDSHFSVFLY